MERYLHYRRGSGTLPCCARAVRMVFEHQYEYPSQCRAICSIAEKLDINHETLGVRVRRAEVDGRAASGVDEGRACQAACSSMRTANCAARTSLKAASAFFARELGPRPPK
jgi:transposase